CLTNRWIASVRGVYGAVYQAIGQRLLTAPYTPLTDAIHLFVRQLSTLGHALHKRIVDAVYLHLEDIPLVGRQWAIHVTQEIGIFSGFYPIEGNAQFIRSEEHTSELQSRENLVCRLLLE